MASESAIFETIRIDNSIPLHLEFHEQRLNRSRSALGFGNNELRLSEFITVPPENRRGAVRCRIEAREQIESMRFEPYTAKPIRSLGLVESEIRYDHKFVDRTPFDALSRRYPQYDDILIIRDGFLTDSLIANIALFDGSCWVTPHTPLLAGTTRTRLLDEGLLFERPVRAADIVKYSSIVLINALRGFDPATGIAPNHIHSVS